MADPLKQDDSKQAELAGTKRLRIDPDTNEDSWGDSDQLAIDERHYSETDIQERILDQMLARRRKTEKEEHKASEEGTQIQADIYSERPFLKELMIDIVYKRRKTDE